MRRFEVGLKFLPQPDLLESSIPQSHVILLTNDGSELTPRVIAKLEEKRSRVVVLNLKGIKDPLTENAISLEDSSDLEIGNAIRKVQEKYGKIGSFIHLHPHFEFEKGNFSQHFFIEREIIKTLFFVSKHIQSDLNELGKDHRVNFFCCTRLDGHLGQAKRGNTSIVASGISGLVKCLNLEWPPVFCRVVDIQPELSTSQITNQIMAEYQDANVSLVEVAYSLEGRKTTITIPSEVLENQTITTTVNKNSVFLVSGGAKGVTANCVIEMAKTFKCKFILLGRSSLDFNIPEYAKKESNEVALKRLIMDDLKEKNGKVSLQEVKKFFNNIISKKEIEGTLSAIQNLGGEVIYIQGDVTDMASFNQGLRAASKKLGKVTGIIHGAGILADKYIQNKTERDFEDVLSVKLDGLMTLLSAVNIHQLDHLILFSSVAGFYGNVGQTDYAISNEILSKAAYLIGANHPNTQVTAINWGAWDSGMVSGELKAQFEKAGISLVNSEGGAAMLVNEFNIDYINQHQVIIGSTLPTAVSHLGDLKSYRIQRKLKLEYNPFLNHHKIQNIPVLPVVNAVAWMAQSCERLYPDYAVFKIENTSLFKGIIFDGKEKENYFLEIRELKKDEEIIVFETMVYSEGKKLQTNHYRATITLVSRKSFPSPPKFIHQLSETYETLEGHLLYQDGSLFHAPYFQGIKQILDCTEKQIVLSCEATEVPLSEQGQFPTDCINTFFADIQYQGMLVWVQKYYDGAKSLPLQTDCAMLYLPVPFGKKLFVHIKIREANEVKLSADCTVYDELGNVYIKTIGASVTISRQLAW